MKVLSTRVRHAKYKNCHIRPYYTTIELLVLDTDRIDLNNSFVINIHYCLFHDMLYLDIQCLYHISMSTRKQKSTSFIN